MKPYYLLWGYRKCGTTSLWRTLRSNGVSVPDWDESNIWLADSAHFPALFETLWGRQIGDSRYLVDLSTLTHLSPIDISRALGEYGYEPKYIVCRRDPADRWISAFTHMLSKSADHRSASAYLDFYARFIGLNTADLLLLEKDLIARDLRAGKKSTRGLLSREYFKDSYPIGFASAVEGVDYQFRYFGETVDMLTKAPECYTSLQLEDWPATRQWIEQTFGVTCNAQQQRPANAGSVNMLSNRPAVKQAARFIPRSLRRQVRATLESSWFTGALPRALDTGVQNALKQMIREMLATEQTQ